MANIYADEQFPKPVVELLRELGQAGKIVSVVRRAK